MTTNEGLAYRRAASHTARALAIAFALIALPWNPGAETLEEDTGYVGDAVCASCHADLLSHYEQTVHAKLLNARNARTALMRRGCEACHGPGQAHVAAGGGRGGDASWISFAGESREAAGRQTDACLACHEGRTQIYWEGSPHQSRGASCTACHQVMRNVSDDHQLLAATEAETCARCHPMARSKSYRSSHMPTRTGIVKEGWMSCGACHNPHGTVTEGLIDAHSVNDNCYSCHADKRGPFLWEHAPVSESCLNCHDPHGTLTANMLKLSPPRLCQTCHIASLHPSEPHAPNDRMVISRSCSNCHQQVHGSNHPSGMALTR